MNDREFLESLGLGKDTDKWNRGDTNVIVALTLSLSLFTGAIFWAIKLAQHSAC